MRFNDRRMIVGIAALAALGGVGAYACAGGDDEGAAWAIVTRDYDSVGDSAVLTPGNDTRVNLMLLLADRTPGTRIVPPAATKPNAKFDWFTFAAQAAPEPKENVDPSADWVEASRCQSNRAGAADFITAVKASGSIPASEKIPLVTARQQLDPWNKPTQQYGQTTCGGSFPAPNVSGIASPGGLEFARYLRAAGDFYRGDFAPATDTFSGLAPSRDPWLRETAIYMVARSKLNAAQQFDEYGELAAPEKRDRAAIAAAGAAFNDYIRQYPQGRYAASARGLLRRVAWLGGDTQALTTAYTGIIDASTRTKSLDAAKALTDEVDYKLLADLDAGNVNGAVLLAVADLMRMRKQSAEAYCEGQLSWCFKPITKAEIDAQRGKFGNERDLYDYIRAAEAFFVRRQPREVLQIIPDASHQKRFTYLQFSRQMLRGFALEALGDRNSRAFLNDLFVGATQPFQRDAVELQLAIHDERSGNLPLVFAPNSSIRNPFIREILLTHTAGPDLLRQQAQRGPTKDERDAALYMLLAKQLRHGAYASFLSDVRMVPANADAKAGFYSLEDAGEVSPDRKIGVGVFTLSKGVGDYECAPIGNIVTTLAQSATNVRGRLCLAEFMREQGLDWNWGDFDKPLDNGGLASTRPLFPGPVNSRLEIYKAVVNDKAATADETAFALYRAIRCYEPSGNNDCGGTEVALSVRRSWFNRLKKSYPQSRWAKSLKYYW